MGLFDLFRGITFKKAKGKVKMTTSYDRLRSVQLDSIQARKKLFKLDKKVVVLNSISNRSSLSDKDLAEFLEVEKQVAQLISDLQSLFSGMISSASSLYSGLSSNYNSLSGLNNHVISSYKPVMPANPDNVQQVMRDYQEKVNKVKAIGDLNTSYANAVETIKRDLVSHSKSLLERKGVIKAKN